MESNRVSRRRFIAGAAVGAFAATGSAARATQNQAGSEASFSFCFNTSTIRGQKLSLNKEVEIAAEAGYSGVEPWVDKVRAYAESGSLRDLRKKISDLGLTVEGAISFARWIVDDDDERAKGLEQAKREMDLMAQIGGKRIAAPPAGANRRTGVEPMKAAQRYRAMLELGDQMGIVPEFELWGTAKNLNHVGEAMCVVIESGHPKACLLPDVFHVYKGGSSFLGFREISAQAIHVFHLNDYPAEPPRETITDRYRVYPGDGIAPLTQLLRELHANGRQAALSLELFNPAYWKQDPLMVAKTGLAKMKATVSKALKRSSAT